jgi:hypothetical protein
MFDPGLVTGVMQGLSLLLPAAGNAAGAAAGAIGGAVVTGVGTDLYNKAKEQAKRLLGVIHDRFSQEPDGGGAAKALQTYIDGDRDFEPVVKTKLERILNGDPAFAAQLLTILRSGPLQSLMVGEEASARRVEMSNRLGDGTQIIQEDRRAVVEDVKMNISPQD